LEEEQQYLQAQQQHPQPPMQPNQPPMQPPEQQYLPQHQFQRGPPGGHQPMMRPVPPRNQPGLENESLSQRVLNEAKEPLLVSVLVIIMSSPQLQSLIARFLPIAASNPLIGLAVRAVFAGVLFGFCVDSYQVLNHSHPTMNDHNSLDRRSVDRRESLE
jgi:hypothetical protein